MSDSVLDNRIKNNKKIEDLLKGGLDTCKATFLGDHEAIVEYIGAGNYGVVFKITQQKDGENLVFVAKMMSITSENQNEAALYKLVKDDVVGLKIPHLPLTWDAKECDSKCNYLSVEQIVEQKEEKKENVIRILNDASESCYLIFAELFDGDITSLLSDTNKTDEQMCKLIFSIFLQVGMAQAYLFSKKYNHNDMNPGNITFLKLEEKNKDGYFEYNCNDKKVYIKHCGFLFVLWDFGLATQRIKKFIPSNFTKQFVETVTHEKLPKNFLGFYQNFSPLQIESSFIFECLFLSWGCKYYIDKNKYPKAYSLLDTLFKGFRKMLFAGQTDALNVEETWLFSKEFKNMIPEESLHWFDEVFPNNPPLDITKKYTADYVKKN
jgi:serine/threonine protein kinase